jgi:ELWxxDGT repeat protein
VAAIEKGENRATCGRRRETARALAVWRRRFFGKAPGPGVLAGPAPTHSQGIPIVHAIRRTTTVVPLPRGPDRRIPPQSRRRFGADRGRKNGDHANDGTRGFGLWKSDGTAAGTVLVKDIFPGAESSNPWIGHHQLTEAEPALLGEERGAATADFFNGAEDGLAILVARAVLSENPSTRSTAGNAGLCRAR